MFIKTTVRLHLNYRIIDISNKDIKVNFRDFHKYTQEQILSYRYCSFTKPF